MLKMEYLKPHTFNERHGIELYSPWENFHWKPPNDLCNTYKSPGAQFKEDL